jgi:hypothetical protein
MSATLVVRMIEAAVIHQRNRRAAAIFGLVVRRVQPFTAARQETKYDAMVNVVMNRKLLPKEA